MMKKFVRIVLLLAGILLIITFLATVAYDYYLIHTRIFGSPLGLQFTIMLSGILFLVPGIVCIIISQIMKRKK